jgi:hypothetical protein
VLEKMTNVETRYPGRLPVWLDTMCEYCARAFCHFMTESYAGSGDAPEVMIHPL